MLLRWPVRTATWLRDEEASASAASVADKSLAEPRSDMARRRRPQRARAGVGAIDDEGAARGRQIGSKRLTLFPEKREVGGSAPTLTTTSMQVVTIPASGPSGCEFFL